MEYLLTVKIRFGADDDVAARERARRELTDMYVLRYSQELAEPFVDPDYEVKFQRLRKDASPEKVEL